MRPKRSRPGAKRPRRSCRGSNPNPNPSPTPTPTPTPTPNPHSTPTPNQVVIESGAKLFVSAVGVPTQATIAKLHAANILVMNMVGAPKHVAKVNKYVSTDLAVSKSVSRK